MDMNHNAIIILTLAQQGNYFSDKILRRSRNFFEPKSETSHAAIVVSPNVSLANAQIMEQTWPHIQLSSLSKYEGKYKAFQCLLLDQAACDRISLKAQQSRGIYAITKIFGFLIDSILSRLLSFPVVLLGKCFRKKWKGWDLRLFSRIDLTGTTVCSQFVGKLFAEEGIWFGKPWYELVPDDMDDWCKEHPHIFKRLV